MTALSVFAVTLFGSFVGCILGAWAVGWYISGGTRE